jgi:predicted O-methyltransferase YrrM
MKTINDSFTLKRILQALGYTIKYPYLFKDCIKHNVPFLYANGKMKKKSLPIISLEKIVSLNKEIKLLNSNGREGNIGSLEIFILALIIAERNPLNMLEIGTFDGNTTLQMAINSQDNARIHTIDLPSEATSTKIAISNREMKFVFDEKKKKRKFEGSIVHHKIIQHFGDSAEYDFQKFTDRGPIDFCFIDGSHTYKYVKSDTEKVLKILSPKGMILWHDFNPNWPGVYNYLLEIGKQYSLQHIEGTSFACYFANKQ